MNEANERMPAAAPGFRGRWQRWMKRWWFRRGLEVAFALTALVVVGLWQGRDLLPSGQPLPALTLRTLDGKMQSLAALRGKRVLLTFWAPWCAVCKAETGALSALHRAHPEVAVISVALDYRDMAQVHHFVDAEGVDYPVLLGNDEVQRKLHVRAFPTTYFIGKDGRIEHAAVGYTTGLGLRARLWL